MKQLIKSLVIVSTIATVTTMATPPVQTSVETHQAAVLSETTISTSFKENVPEPPVVVSKPVIVEPVSAPARASSGSCADYLPIIQKYDWNAGIAQAIMRAESSCVAGNVGDNYPIRGLHAPSCGLFQVRTLAGRPSCEQLKDPETNVAWAYRLYSESGWSPWTVFNNGTYRKYL